MTPKDAAITTEMLGAARRLQEAHSLDSVLILATSQDGEGIVSRFHASAGNKYAASHAATRFLQEQKDQEEPEAPEDRL